MSLTRDDLRYNDYRWHAAWARDGAAASEDDEGFDPREGNEVLQVINAIHGVGGSDMTLRTRQILEWMIHERLPASVRNRFEVIAWLIEHYTDCSHEYVD